MKREPWKYQKEFSERGEVPTPEQIKNIIVAIPCKKTQALAAILYLTAARISEVVGRKYIYETSRQPRKDQAVFIFESKRGKKLYYYKKRQHEDKGLTPSHFKVEERGDHVIILIRLLNRKNRKRKYKEIPLSYKNERILLQLIIDYVSTFKDQNAELFNFNSNWAYKLMKKYTGYNPHWLRHVRLTHLITMPEYEFNAVKLKKWAGWSDSRPADSYEELAWGDLLPKV